MADSLITYFSNINNISNIKECIKYGMIFKTINSIVQSTITNKSFVFTGNLENYSRKQAVDIIENYGAKASLSISLKTNFVVAGSKAGKKLYKAKKLNIKILTEKDFIKLIKGIS